MVRAEENRHPLPDSSGLMPRVQKNVEYFALFSPSDYIFGPAQLLAKRPENQRRSEVE